jgi:separase
LSEFEKHNSCKAARAAPNRIGRAKPHQACQTKTPATMNLKLQEYHVSTIPSTMTVATPSMDAPLKNVKEDIRSIATISNATLNVLRSLLGLDLIHDDTEAQCLARKNPSSKVTKKAVPSSMKQKPRRAKVRGGQDFTICETPQPAINPLPHDLKRKLATETFNTTLKYLSDAAKTISTGQGAARPVQAGNKSFQRPLQNCSPNRKSQPNINGKTTKTAQFGDVADLDSIAECATSALEYLRHLEDSNPDGQDDQVKDWRLERGALIMLDKLITLKLKRHVFKAVIKAKLHMQRRVKHPNETDAKRESVEECSLSDALFTDLDSEDKDVFSLITSFQSQVLRVALLFGRSTIDRKMLAALEPASASGPTGVILTGVKQGLLSAEQGSQQLRTLSQAIMTLCASTAESGSDSTTPEVVFELRVIALQIRWHAFNLLPRETKAQHEIWLHFGRALCRYRDECRSKEKEDYLMVKDALRSLQLTSNQDHLPANVIGVLADMAQHAGVVSDSLSMLETQSRGAEGQTAIAVLLCRCKIATLRLSSWEEDRHASLASAEQTLASLSGTLKGSATDMNDLLLYGARLRKAALRVSTEVENLINKGTAAQVDIGLQICTIRLIYGFLDFVVRYLGSPSRTDSDLAGTRKHLERNEALELVGHKSIDAVLNAVKCSNAWTAFLLTETDAALQKCYALATLLEEQFTKSYPQTDLVQSRPSLFVLISNTYWSQCLEKKGSNSKRQSICLLLERSIEILVNRSSVEQEQGFLASKYSKLSSVYVDTKSFEKAKRAQSSAIILLIKLGALTKAVELALSSPSRHIWSDQSSKVGILGKSLSAFIALSSAQDLTVRKDDILFDDTSLPAIHRAVLLEKQILLCADIASDSLRDHVVTASREVLDIYESPSFWVCRLRFAYGLLAISSKNDQFPATEILSSRIVAITDAEQTDNCTKSFLTSYGPVLLASVRMHWMLQTSRPNQMALDVILMELRTCLRNCPETASLETIVDDSHALTLQLQSVIDYAGMQDLKFVKLNALLTLRQVLECQQSKDNADLILCLTSIGTLQTQVGDTVEAGQTFATAEKFLSTTDATRPTIIQWELAYAEYLLEISDTRKSLEVLQSAGAKYDIEVRQNRHPSSRLRIKQENFLVYGAFVASKLAFAEGNLETAILRGRQCVKASTGIWMCLEKLWDNVEELGAYQAQEYSSQNLTEGISLSFSIDRSFHRSMPKGAIFWQHIELHHKALMHASSLCAHSGLYQDSVYYAEQAYKVGLSTHASGLIVTAQSALSVLYSRASQSELAFKSLQALDSHISSLADGIDLCRLHFNRANSYVSLGDVNMAQSCLALAKNNLSKLKRAYPVDVAVISNQELALTSDMAAMKISESKPLKASRKTQIQPRGGRVGKSSQSHPMKDVTAPPTGHCQRGLSHQELLDAIFMLKIQISLQSGDLTTAASHLAVSGKVAPIRSTQHHLLEASLMISQALEAFASDAVHCVLAETTISLPSRHQRDSTIDDKPSTENMSCLTRLAKDHTMSVKAPQRKAHVEVFKSKPQDLLCHAYTLLLEASNSRLLDTPSDVVHQIHKTLSHLTLLTSAISPKKSYSPAQFLSRSLAPNDLLRQREVWTMNAEIKTAEWSQVQNWPVIPFKQLQDSNETAGSPTSSPTGSPTNSPTNSPTISTQGEVLGLLPSFWTVVSLSLSSDKSELVISRIYAAESPFVLRIPLVRSIADELEETEFSFQDAKKELADIISQANITAHDARGQADKAARKIWWAEREALDRRLETLLKNIESIWLGGFRGILSPTWIDHGLLERFAESLYQSLEKHLPSRKRSGRKSKAKVQLHTHVIELFLALGHPDREDLDDYITDLLNFVVDILQLSGECNAYDEIDFDIIMLEVRDALRSYHEACLPTPAQAQHIVLILDKELHAFPWESLPCLSQQPVSRMPSMGELNDRLKSIREQNEGDSLIIPPGSGAYILNPSSDLSSTQDTFESAFESQLPDFTSIINRAPTEQEFESCLRDNKLFLYFGHGSGAQYIRGRTIKKLKQCAVTFLMGCSSSKMVECGVYEPYGVPWNYMFAGAPAVVGTLWDVTDKDIDRFAMRTFTNWGLLDADTIEDGKKSKGKDKRRAGSQQTAASWCDSRVGQMALDEAVANARDSCVLRYLNGAAPVIYGCPVFLKKLT